MIKGNWKLVHTNGNPTQNYQLYNVGNDVGETNNLAAANPEQVAEMLRDLTDHEVTFDKQRFAILGRTAEDTINLFDHFTFRPGAGTGLPGDNVLKNFGFEDGLMLNGNDATYTFAELNDWSNDGSNSGAPGNEVGSRNDNAGAFAGSFKGIISGDRTPFQVTEHSIALGEEFSISLAHSGQSSWSAPNDSYNMELFYLDDSGSVVVLDSVNVAPPSNWTWTTFSHEFDPITDANAVGRSLGIRFDSLTGDNEFAALDEVFLSSSNATDTFLTNWSASGAWFEGGTETVESMFASDAFAGAILEFPVSDEVNYISNNDMVRTTGQAFMLNKMILSGAFAGTTDRFANIQGNELLFTRDLSGNGPELAVDATNGNQAFSYDIDLDLVLYDNLRISGNGNVPVTINGQIRDYFESRGFTKTGASRIVLNGENTYSGSTRIAGGTLALGSTGSIRQSDRVTVLDGAQLDVTSAANGEFAVAAGQVLAGDGLVVGDVVASNGSVVAPGDEIGTLSIQGDYRHEVGSVLEIQLTGAGHDSLNVAGIVELQFGDLSVVAGDGFQPMMGATYDILDFVSLSGDFASVNLPSLIGGLSWDTSDLLTSGILSIASDGLGDFNDDGNWDCTDIDALVAAIASGANDPDFDMNGDGVVDAADVTDDTLGWLAVGGANNVDATGGGTFISGDANLDGVVDISDFNVWNANKFTSQAVWCRGDFSVDGAVDISDFNIWNSRKFTSSSDARVVPEPSCVSLLMIAMVCFLAVGRGLPSSPSQLRACERRPGGSDAVAAGEGMCLNENRTVRFAVKRRHG